MASIQGIYVALFGRPADPTGLAYFNSVTKNGTDLSGISNLTGTAEYQSRFAGMSSEQVVNAIYQSLLGRSGEASGIQFWVQQMQSGRFNINNIAIAVLDGAKESDLQMVTAKVAAADLFTARLDTPAKIAAYVGNTAAQAARDFLTTVTKDNPGTAAAIDSTVTKVQTLATNPTDGVPSTGTGTTTGGGAGTGGGGGTGGPTPDTTPPDAPTVLVSKAGISGTAEAGSTIALRVGTQILAEDIKTDQKGHWAYAGKLPASNGDELTFTATATDPANNVSKATTVKAVYDNVAPEAPTVHFEASPQLFDGQAEPGSTVHIKMDDIELGSAKVDAYGTWSFKTKLPLNNGGYVNVTATATDGADNASDATTTKISYDNVPPDPPTIRFGATDKSLSGETEPGATLAIQGDGVNIGYAKANGLGQWTYTGKLPTSNGSAEVTFTAIAADYTGNMSAASVLKVTYNNASPPPPSVSYAANGFSGEASAGSTVQLKIGDLDLGSVKADAFGHWSFKPNLPLNNGSYVKVTATASNGADTVSEPATIDISYDNIAPDAPTIHFNPTDKSLSGETEPEATLAIQADGVNIGYAKANGLGQWTYTGKLPTSAGSTEITFAVRAFDYYGNESAAGVLKVINQNSAPDFASSSVSVDLKDSSAVGTTIYTAAATDADHDKLTYSLSSGDKSLFAVDADGTIKLLKAVDYGQMQTASIDVAVSDGANHATQTITFNVKDDTRPVFLSGSSATIDENNAPNAVVYKASASDNSKQGLVYTLDESSKADFSMSADGTVTANRSFDFEAPGNPASIKMIATDQAGNSTTQSVEFSIRDLVEDSTFTGTNSADVIDKSGSVNNWTIYGKAGNDTIKGGSGNDKIDPGSGYDTVDISGGGFDTIYINSKDRLPTDQTQDGLLRIKGFRGGDPLLVGTKGILAFDVKDVIDAKGTPKTYTTPFQVDPLSGYLKGNPADVTDRVALVFSNDFSDRNSLAQLIQNESLHVDNGGRAYFLVGAPKNPLFYIYYAEVPDNGISSYAFLHVVGMVEMQSGQDVEFVDRANLLFI